MKCQLEKYDWIRVILMVIFSGYLWNQIYIKTNMLLKKETGFTEVENDSDEVILPSITFCPGTLMPKQLNKVDNITADYLNLPRIEDMLQYLQQPIYINK